MSLSWAERVARLSPHPRPLATHRPATPRCGCQCTGAWWNAWGGHRKYHSYFEGHRHFLCGYRRRGTFRQRKLRENQSGARCSPQGLEETEAGRRGVSWPGPVETVPHGALALRSVGAVRARPGRALWRSLREAVLLGVGEGSR